MSGESQKRDYFFDNVKFVLITLVVVGHAIRHFIEDHPWVHAAYLTIFTFHMPLFILIAGYFSKNFSKEGQSRKVVATILIPYLIFQILYTAADRIVTGSDYLGLSILDPYWILWFLFSLFMWRIILPYFIHLKYPLVTALLLGLLSGYVEKVDSFMSLSRTFAFFPFFLAGYYLERHHFERLFSLVKKGPAVLGLAGIFLLMYWLEFGSGLDIQWRRWLYFTFPYEDLGHPEWYAGGYRLFLYGLAAFASACFLVLIPRRKSMISELGSRSLYVYLWHGFFIRLFKGLWPEDRIASSLDILLVVLASIALSFFLASRWVQQWTWPLVQPRMGWFLQKE